MKGQRYAVWRVNYGTYDDVARDGDIKPVRVERNLSLGDAQIKAATLGWQGRNAHCVKEDDPCQV